MYIWTDELRKIALEIGDYIRDGKAVPEAPAGTQEKYDKMMEELNKRRKQFEKMGF